MDIDDERSSRKRSAEITSEEMRSKILVVNPPHSKNNFSNNASESHLGESALKRGMSRLINTLKMTFSSLSYTYTRTSRR